MGWAMLQYAMYEIDMEIFMASLCAVINELNLRPEHSFVKTKLGYFKKNTH